MHDRGPGQLFRGRRPNPLPRSVMRRLLLLLAALRPVMTQAQTDKTLQRIKERKAINIAYRTDAAPFSCEEGGQPAGYSVALCKRVVTSLEQQLKVQPLSAAVSSSEDPSVDGSSGVQDRSSR